MVKVTKRIKKTAGGFPDYVKEHFNFLGLAFAVIFFSFSLTPSLLPRVWLLQGFVSGLAVLIGYLLGVLVSFTFRKLFEVQPSREQKRRIWKVILIVSPIIIVLFLYLGHTWQQDLRALTDQDPNTGAYPILVLLISFLIASFFILIFRFLRIVYHWIGKVLLRFIPKKIAYIISFILVLILTVSFIDGILITKTFELLNEVFSVQSQGTREGVEKPTSSYLSGSEESLIPWESLGIAGRDFIDGVATNKELKEFNKKDPKPPIRIYVGLESAASPQEQAELALQEMERTGAFTREIIAINTTTGSGGVSKNATDSLEYMYNGDSAIISSQFSYLPSWISFMVDREKVKANARNMINTIYGKWVDIPVDKRPKLVIYGESLGTYGSENAFTGVVDLQNKADAVLWLGPPFANQLKKEFTENRDEGSLEKLPVYQKGETIRFAQYPPDLDLESKWTDSKVVYLQHASDPVVWWSGDLIFRQPEWMKEERGPDNSPNMVWFPFVTFFQVSVDLVFSIDVPAGHGHRYGNNVVDVWERIIPPSGWDSSDTAALKKIIPHE